MSKPNELIRVMPPEEYAPIILHLFGFEVIDGVIIDQEGDEFYGYAIHDKYDLRTWEGIIDYYAATKAQQAVNDFKRTVKNIFKETYQT